MTIHTALRLKDLPPPPPGKTGWPWTEQPENIPDKMSNGSDWPHISIVTPNYNYGHFLEETIRSILLQGYPNLEYIVIDGGSSDNSVEVIKKYQDFIDYWVSEKDKGQTSAINRGLKHCTGDIFNWINSDDQLLPNALYDVAQSWNLHQPDILIGSSIGVDASSGDKLHHLVPRIPKNPLEFINDGQFGLQISQPSAFLRLSLVQEMGYLSEDLNYAFDWAFYLKVLVKLRNVNIITLPNIISKFLVHPDAKTMKYQSLFVEEGKKVCGKLYSDFQPIEKIQISWHLKQVESFQIVTEALSNKKRSFSLMIELLFRNPQLCLSRFFWGALKREIFFQGMKSE
ncbi:MAG: glycosyltransferase family 2 protein [Nostoc sp.]|uniref:glycosyltransferase family 2 protein n=1 Tax=Nostoc sp. TaxID=1180 RepID=UPI002FFB54CD